MTISQAAAFYDTTERTVHRWKKAGEEAGKPCPWDRPGEMPAWWAVCMTRRCPDEILRRAGECLELPLPETAARAPGTAQKGEGYAAPGALPPDSDGAEAPFSPTVLSPQDLALLREKELANVLAKLDAGITLTTREWDIVNSRCKPTPGLSSAPGEPQTAGEMSGSGEGEGIKVSVKDGATSLDRLRAVESGLGDAYAKALESGETARAGALHRQWREISEQLRKAEVTHAEMQRKADKERANDGELIPKAAVCAALDKLHGNIPRRLRDVLWLSYKDVQRAVRDEESFYKWTGEFVRGFCHRLTATRFADILEPIASAGELRSEPE